MSKHNDGNPPSGSSKPSSSSRDGRDGGRGRRRGRGGRGRARKLEVAESLPTAPETIERLSRTLEEGEYVVFDIETTGGNPEKNGITEIFAIKWCGGEIKDTYYSLVNPGIPIPPIVRRMTGINNQMVKGAPRIDEIMPGFVQFVGGDVLVSHNTIGDMKFIRYFAKTAAGVSMDNFYLCTHLLVEKLASEAPDKSLKGLADYFKLAKGELHRAEADAYVTLDLFKVLLGKLKARSVRRIDEAVRLQGDMESGMRLGWGVKDAALEAIPQGPGVFFLHDHEGKLLFLSSAMHLDREVAKLRAFHQLPRQLLRLALRSYDIKAERTPNAYAAMLLEAERMRGQKLTFTPYAWHQRQVQALFVADVAGGPGTRLAVGPLEAGTRLAFGPVRDRKLATDFLDEVAKVLAKELPEAEVKASRDGLIVPRDLEADLTALLSGRLGDEATRLAKSSRSLALWFKPAARKQQKRRLQLLQALLQIPRQPRLAPLHDRAGVLLVPPGQAHVIAGARPRGVLPVPPAAFKGDASAALRDAGLTASLSEKIAAAQADDRNGGPMSALDADQANATLWWIFNGRHESRFVPVEELTR